MESIFNDSSLDNLAKQSGFSIRNRRLNGSLFFKRFFLIIWIL